MPPPPDQTTTTARLADWLGRARLARKLRAAGELLPAWSTGELLAVAVILDDAELLADLDYTTTDALDRLRFDIGAASVEAAATILAGLRSQLDEENGSHLPTVGQLLSNVIAELDQARNALSDAASWLRSDWRPVGSALTDEQSAARAAGRAAVVEAQAIIDRAKAAMWDAAEWS